MADLEETHREETATEGTTARIGETQSLSNSQRERIQRNKEKAMTIRQARLQAKPYDASNRPQQYTAGKIRETG